MKSETRIDLPNYVTGSYEVYVNGVPQAAGTDYRVDGSSLFFERSLEQEGKLGMWRWARIALGIAGSYRKHDTIDVIYTREGRRTVVSLVPVAVEPEGTEPG